jgi:hypothetical protein
VRRRATTDPEFEAVEKLCDAVIALQDQGWRRLDIAALALETVDVSEDWEEEIGAEEFVWAHRGRGGDR